MQQQRCVEIVEISRIVRTTGLCPMLNAMAKFLLMLVFATHGVAFPQDADTTRSPADIFGRVTHAKTRGPVRRVALNIFNASGEWDTITNGDGRFRLDFPALCPPAHLVRVSSCRL